MKRPFRGSEEEVWVKGDQLANNLTFIISRNNSELWWEQPPEWGQNYWREQIVALPHHTTWKQKRGEWCREGKSVKKCDFCNMHGLGVFFLKITRLLKTNKAILPPALLPWLPSLFAGCPRWELGFPKKDQHPRGQVTPLQKGGCVLEWEVNPPGRLEACLIFKAAMPVLSNHTFWASIRNCYISVFPPCYGLSHFRDQLQITVERLSVKHRMCGLGKSTMPLP